MYLHLDELLLLGCSSKAWLTLCFVEVTHLTQYSCLGNELFFLLLALLAVVRKNDSGKARKHCIFTEGNLNHKHNQFSPEKLSNCSNFNISKISRFYLLTDQIILVSPLYQSKKPRKQISLNFWDLLLFHCWFFSYLNSNLISFFFVIEERKKNQNRLFYVLLCPRFYYINASFHNNRNY